MQQQIPLGACLLATSPTRGLLPAATLQPARQQCHVKRFSIYYSKTSPLDATSAPILYRVCNDAFPTKPCHGQVKMESFVLSVSVLYRGTRPNGAIVAPDTGRDTPLRHLPQRIHSFVGAAAFPCCPEERHEEFLVRPDAVSCHVLPNDRSKPRARSRQTLKKKCLRLRLKDLIACGHCPQNKCEGTS